jgi:hypothetical protein
MKTTRADSGMSIAFPDVCKIPAPPPPAGPGGIPIPYPNFAKTAQKTQQKKTAGSVKPTGGFKPISGNEAGTLKNTMTTTSIGGSSIVSGARNAEIGQLKGVLSGLNTKLVTLSTSDANEWQKVIQEIAVAASALYLTLHSDDD